jgi:hypothetical protein
MIDLHVRDSRPGLNVVDCDATAREIDSNTFHHAGNCSLRHRVNALAKMPTSHRGLAADRSDPPTFNEARSRSLDGEKDTSHVDVQHPVKTFHAHRRDLAKQQNASVDDRNIQSPEAIHGLHDGRLDRRWISAVRLMARPVRPAASIAPNRFGRSLRRRHVGHRYVGPPRLPIVLLPQHQCLANRRRQWQPFLQIYDSRSLLSPFLTD